jgi:3-phenylpropionate/trans-cinnamate dioxygenase ferredoxin subunit
MNGEEVDMVPVVQIGVIGEMESGDMRAVQVNGREVLVARVGNEYFATDNRCPHMGGNLSRGTLQGTIVTCPRHGSRFDLSGGRVVRWLGGSGFLAAVGKALKAPRPLATYKVEVSGDRIMLWT